MSNPFPGPAPQKTVDACIQNFPKISIKYGGGRGGGGGGGLQAIFEKDALFYDGTQKLQKIMNTALLSKGL